MPCEAMAHKTSHLFVRVPPDIPGSETYYILVSLPYLPKVSSIDLKKIQR